jgi:hypothetical protein
MLSYHLHFNQKKKGKRDEASPYINSINKPNKQKQQQDFDGVKRQKIAYFQSPLLELVHDRELLKPCSDSLP